MRLPPRSLLAACCVALVGGAGIGCARRAPAPAPASADDSAGAPLPDSEEARELVVENQHTSDVAISLQASGGSRVRLGTVAGSTTRTLAIPGRMAAGSRHLVLVAHPIGARETYSSERFTVQSGQRVVWTLATQLSRSSLAIY